MKRMVLPVVAFGLWLYVERSLEQTWALQSYMLRHPADDTWIRVWWLFGFAAAATWIGVALTRRKATHLERGGR